MKLRAYLLDGRKVIAAPMDGTLSEAAAARFRAELAAQGIEAILVRDPLDVVDLRRESIRERFRRWFR